MKDPEFQKLHSSEPEVVADEPGLPPPPPVAWPSVFVARFCGPLVRGIPTWAAKAASNRWLIILYLIPGTPEE